jgi:hypothetical protein
MEISTSTIGGDKPMLAGAQNGEAIAFGTTEAADDELGADPSATLAGSEQFVDEKIPTFEETYPKYEFAPLVALAVYLADECTVRRHAAYLWAFLIACGGAGMVLLGILT